MTEPQIAMAQKLEQQLMKELFTAILASLMAPSPTVSSRNTRDEIPVDQLSKFSHDFDALFKLKGPLSTDEDENEDSTVEAVKESLAKTKNISISKSQSYQVEDETADVNVPNKSDDNKVGH